MIQFTGPLDWLFGLDQFGVKLGLDNINTLLDALGHPERAFRSVHVAGTNGKGSVTAMIDASIRAAGHRSARYTSPHLLDLREVVEALVATGALQAPPTFFELTTAADFELFRRAGVDLAVCEVGLGGR